MASNSHVSSRTPDVFGYYKIAEARGVSLASANNAIAVMPVLGGGLSGSGATNTSGAAVIRRVTVSNFVSGNIGYANITIGLTNDGGNVYASGVMANLTANSTWQDLTLSATAGNTMISGNVSSTLFVNLAANATANAAVNVMVYGDIINP